MPSKLEYVNFSVRGDVVHASFGIEVPLAEWDIHSIIQCGFSIMPPQMPPPLPGFDPAVDVRQSPAEHNEAETPAAPLAEAGQRRRRRTQAEMRASREEHFPLGTSLHGPQADPNAFAGQHSEAAGEAIAATPPSTEPTRRRRAAPPADVVPVFTDVEMSKAASNAAEELVKLGEDGPALVKLILGDYKVASVNEIPAELREKFISELASEVELAKQEKSA